MAAKEISVKKYVVRLNGEEREQLEALIRKGKSAAQRLLKARILLKADVSEAGEGWSDNRIIKALETTASMVYRVRKQLVEEGFEAADISLTWINVMRPSRAHPGKFAAGPQGGRSGQRAFAVHSDDHLPMRRRRSKAGSAFRLSRTIRNAKQCDVAPRKNAGN